MTARALCLWNSRCSVEHVANLDDQEDQDLAHELLHRVDRAHGPLDRELVGVRIEVPAKLERVIRLSCTMAAWASPVTFQKRPSLQLNLDEHDVRDGALDEVHTQVVSILVNKNKQTMLKCTRTLSAFS